VAVALAVVPGLKEFLKSLKDKFVGCTRESSRARVIVPSAVKKSTIDWGRLKRRVVDVGVSRFWTG
jgi:hypothetical protein